MKIFGRDIKAIIFDMDGTLIESTGIWFKIDQDFFKKRGMDKVPEGYAEEIVHMGLQKGAQMTIEKYGFNDTVEEVISEWQKASEDQYKYHIELKPYAREVLHYLNENGVRLGLATANDENLYSPCLDRLDIRKYFDIITDVNIVNEGKKSSKIFDLIADFFNLKKEEIMVVEDTIVGLTTAYNSGYFAVGIDDFASRNSEDRKKENCHKYIYSLKEFLD